ncbi:MAG: 30S ribosomal protein S3ae [Candidatus Heimdallarchaeota archaeon]|nr:MAG: 30S ribosomal protein S3ae [Candidatus Heimdallarchaeota archaeon]
MVDKWSAKEIYQIYSPPGFLDGDEKVVGESISDDPNKLIGRVIEVSLTDLNNDYSKMHVKLQFQIVEVVGNTARTRFKGHSFARDYLRFLVRRRRSRIDSISTVNTKDGVPFRITATGFTMHRSKTSQKYAIRNKMLEVIAQRASELNSEDFIRETTGGKLSSLIYFQCKPIYPLKGVEIQKSKVLKAVTPD